jgi:hypothetical protein
MKTLQNFTKLPLNLKLPRQSSKVYNFILQTSNLMQCPHPLGLDIKSNGKRGEMTFYAPETFIKF